MAKQFLLRTVANTVLCLTFSLSLALSSFASSANEKRVVALAPHLVEMLFAIGAGEQIIATVEYADFPEAAKNIPRIGGYYGIQVEKILSLNPDVIFVWRTGNKASDIEQLQRLGFQVVFSEAKTINDVAKEIRQLGLILDKQQQAEQVAEKFEQRLRHIKQKYQEHTKLSAFYQLWPEPMMTANKNTWIHELMTLCHVDNVFAENTTQYPQIGFENVIVAQPQLIIIPDERANKPVPVINWQRWSEIPAVKSNSFIYVNADLLHRFSIRMLDGAEDMCNKIEIARSALSDQPSNN